MSKDYRAIRASYGFRGKYWTEGEIAKNVAHDEKINEHFIEVSHAVPAKPEPVEEEINTLSQLQATENPVKPVKKSSNK